MSRRTDIERFMAHVEIQPDGCWYWTAGREKGYGLFTVKQGVRVRAHRWHYLYRNGEDSIPDGFVCDHTCHKAPCPGGIACLHRRCVNLGHIALVSQVENAARSSRSWQTTCKWGHEYTPENTRMIDGGRRRQCIECQNRRSRGDSPFLI